MSQVSRRDGLDVLVLGPFPPPLGGVSAHVVRLHHAFTRDGLALGVANHFSSSADAPEVVAVLARNPLRYCWCLLRVRSRIVHYHHSRLAMLLATAAVARFDRRPYIATFHGGTIVESLASRTPLVARMTRWAIRQFAEVVVVNAELAEHFTEIVPRERLTVIPAFLPPLEDESSSSAMDEAVDAAITAGQPALVASAYRVSPERDGSDPYGLDLAVQAVELLESRGFAPTLSVFVALPSGSRRERDYLAALADRVTRTTGRQLVVRFAEQLLPALQRNVVYLRPTRADGDAVSVREALSLGVPVVASDVVGRPNGVVLFANGRADALADAIVDVLDGPGFTSDAHDDVQETLTPLRAVYERQLRRTRMSPERAA